MLDYNAISPVHLMIGPDDVRQKWLTKDGWTKGRGAWTRLYPHPLISPQSNTMATDGGSMYIVEAQRGGAGVK